MIPYFQALFIQYGMISALMMYGPNSLDPDHADQEFWDRCLNFFVIYSL